MSNPKLIAFYLPQFHAIPENDKWWGEGFTEWVNTKKAKPLFNGHQQPKTPLNDNYYSLLDSKTQEWQAKLAQDNGVDGFCYYHYWFNGKMLLEKPMENMLANKNITLPFCISWANEPWARTWDGKDKEVLMPQSYGGEKEWKEHFDYLLQFFLDERYIKIDNKPMFVIYRTSNIPDCEEMVKFWNSESKKNGFDGIYLVETMNSFQNSSVINNSDAVVEFEPMITIRHHLPLYKQGIRFIKKKLSVLDKIDYSYVWDRVIKKDVDYGKKKFLGAFVSWDNTARKGKKGLVLTNGNPEKFEKGLRNQILKSKEIDSDFIFINAWNEWAEGTYLESDKLNEFNYITKIKEIR
ncbi:glycoside hydrolase family 99-like domain-containing protein [Clostridium gasigenes]|uniref:glycosyltransferase WbsX family protein n=1 Tax=Clostridium gasigenes TaxID=94869 RepID=UPI001C0CB8CF|nr:glycoside hydrolase family 99-like domain-containing protein [Clostridium gasigenes]MBU3088275.1 glycoside hydrolase family 99-like domain-containing protein [Clostridium gasigenes]